MVVTIWFLFKIHGPPLYVYRPMGQILSESLFLEKKKKRIKNGGEPYQDFHCANCQEFKTRGI